MNYTFAARNSFAVFCPPDSRLRDACCPVTIMEIKINTSNIIADVGSRFLQELKSSDPIPPKGTLIQSLNESRGRLAVIVSRWLDADYKESANDNLSEATEIVYDLRLTVRRSGAKAQAIADLMHSYLVNATLAKCYYIMAQGELAKLHNDQSIADAQAINQLINSKIPPIY